MLTPTRMQPWRRVRCWLAATGLVTGSALAACGGASTPVSSEPSPAPPSPGGPVGTADDGGGGGIDTPERNVFCVQIDCDAGMRTDGGRD
jgi:hypothetical protein